MVTDDDCDAGRLRVDVKAVQIQAVAPARMMIIIPMIAPENLQGTNLDGVRPMKF